MTTDSPVTNHDWRRL